MSDELTRVIRLESENNELQAKIRELEATLLQERNVSVRIATHADKLHLQLQAIREAAIGELCSITADGPENLEGLQERE
jgi:hypothetical protein